MGRCYPHLNLDERRNLAEWLEAKIQVKEIADNLCRAPSTIYREISRNYYRDQEIPEFNGYHAVVAQDAYEERRAVHRKLIRHPDIMAAVWSGFAAGWSPEQIAGRMRLERHPMRVSHALPDRVLRSNVPRRKRFIDMPIPKMAVLRSSISISFDTAELAGHVGGRHFLDELAIKHRPDVIANRSQFGHSLPGRRLQSNLPRGGSSIW